MNRKYIGLGVVVILVVTIILCIFLIPSGSHEAAKAAQESAASGIATTFPPELTTEPPLVSPACPPGSTALTLKDVRVKVGDLESALKTSCAAIEVLELKNVEIMETGGGVVPLPKVTLPQLRRFTFDRFLFPYSFTRPSTMRRYIDDLTELIFTNDFLFLNTKQGGKLSLSEMSTGLGLDYVEVKLNGHSLLTLDRSKGFLQFKRIKKMENKILASIRNDPAFPLRNLTADLSKLDVDLILPKASDLSGLHLYYSSLFSGSDPSGNLHSFLPRLSNLTELHLHLYDAPFDTIDTADLAGLTKLSRFSFQYHGSNRILLTHNNSELTLPGIKYLYVAVDWGKMDPRFIQAIPSLFPTLDSIIFDSYNSAYYDEILYQCLKMPSLLSISFYGYHLFPVKEEERSVHAEEAQGFLRTVGIAPGLADFALTRSTNKARWQGREIRFFEKEGYGRLQQD